MSCLVLLSFTGFHVGSHGMTLVHLLLYDFNICSFSSHVFHLVSFDSMNYIEHYVCLLILSGFSCLYLITRDFIWCILVSLTFTWFDCMSIDFNLYDFNVFGFTICPLTTSCFISCQLVSFDFMCFHVMLLDSMWRCLSSIYFIWVHLISTVFTWFLSMSCHFNWQTCVSRYFIGFNVISLDVMLFHFISQGTWESPQHKREKGKRVGPHLRRIFTLLPHRTHAQHDTKRFPGWAVPPTFDICTDKAN